MTVVQSREIDDAGEANVGVRAFEGTLRDLASAWHLLNAAGVEVCVFTADHGFLLQDATTHVQPLGTKRDPKRRYVLDPHPRAEPGMVNVAVSALGYEGLDGYLLFREDTAVFATGAAGASFVLGGNSLQERVIPVLVVEAKRAPAVTEQHYEIAAEPQKPLVGLHRVSVRVIRSGAPEPKLLPVEQPSPVDVALRVVGRDDVQVTPIQRHCVYYGRTASRTARVDQALRYAIHRRGRDGGVSTALGVGFLICRDRPHAGEGSRRPTGRHDGGRDRALAAGGRARAGATPRDLAS